jgi:hypothetical protein
VINRRDFLKKTAVVATATAASANWTNGLLASPYGMPVGIELYTVRREMAEDAPGTIEKLSKIGFKEVEIVHFGGSVGNAKKLLLACRERNLQSS